MKKAIILVLGILTGCSLVLLCYMLIMYKYMQDANLGRPVPEKTVDEREMHSPFVAPEWDEASARKETKKEKTISISFVGDLNLNGFQELYLSKGISSLISDDCLKELKDSDLTMGNNEFAFSTRGEPQEKEYVFREEPSLVSVLTDMGMDIVSLANNHALDYGTDALVDTMTTLDASNIKYVGAGSDYSEAKKPQMIEVKGKKIGFIAASRVIPNASWNAGSKTPGLFTCYETKGLLKEVEEAKKNCDVVVTYLHWGVEREEYPEDYERKLGKELIDAGADIVIGSHPHILQGFEMYKGKAICYSLGNFLFSRTTDTLILKVDISDKNEISVRVVPCERVGNRVVLKEGKDTLLQYLKGLSFHTEIDEKGVLKEVEGDDQVSKE